MRGSEQGMEPNDQQQELLGALEALGGSAGNGKLRELLGWDEPTHDAVKAPCSAPVCCWRAGDAAAR
ncbi:MAG: hypothetical protein ACKO50_04085 [Cyanobium sp.]